jgi:hypothetical protein
MERTGDSTKRRPIMMVTVSLMHAPVKEHARSVLSNVSLLRTLIHSVLLIWHSCSLFGIRAPYLAFGAPYLAFGAPYLAFGAPYLAFGAPNLALWCSLFGIPPKQVTNFLLYDR